MRFSSAMSASQQAANHIAQEAISQHRSIACLCAEAHVLELYHASLAGCRKATWLAGQVAGVGLGSAQMFAFCAWGLSLWLEHR